LRKGDWKVVSFYGSKWELYNVADDRVEQDDLADKYPEKVHALSARWHELATNTDKLPAEQAQPVRPEPASHTKAEWHNPAVLSEWKMPQF
jgi:arylsulfatase A-like enzyme